MHYKNDKLYNRRQSDITYGRFEVLTPVTAKCSASRRNVVWQICTDRSQVLDALIARGDIAQCTIIKTKTESDSLQITYQESLSYQQGHVKGEKPPGDLQVDKIVSDTEYWDADRIHPVQFSVQWRAFPKTVMNLGFHTNRRPL